MSVCRLNTAGLRLFFDCADNRGTAAGNMRLGDARASSVRAWLDHEYLPAGSNRSAGEGDPVASNATATGRAENGRVVVVPE